MGFLDRLQSAAAAFLAPTENEDLIKGAGGGAVKTATTAGNPAEPDKGPAALLTDPFALIESLGYRERYSSMSYDTLEQLAQRVVIYPGILQTRLNQVAMFAKPQQDMARPGFRIVVREKKKAPTKAEEKLAAGLEIWLENTGSTKSLTRDNFEMYLRKTVRDAMIYDQTGTECVPNRKGVPADFYAIDGASIRLADTAWTDEQDDPDNQIRYVQVHDESVIAEFTPAQLMFGVRNPRTNLRVNGYGYSELEMGIQTVTSLLNSVSYNSKFFSQGSTAKGMLNLPDVPDSKLRIFSRQWHMMLSGVSNCWRTPITNFKEATWIDFHKSNKDMEYGEFLNFLIKIFCSICQIDPTEINFIYGNVGQNSSMFQAPAEEKIVNSKDRGLAPLLNFICANLNRYLIWRINENFKLVFTGLDPREGETTVDLEKKQVTYLKTVNELRAENDLEPLTPEEGDIILDAQWMQAHMNVLQQKQQEEQQQQGGQQPGQDQQEGEQGQEGDEGEEQDQQGPQDQGAPPQQDQGGDFDESEPPPMQMQKSERKATLKKSHHGHVETIEIDL
jgi:hypothetical protein